MMTLAKPEGATHYSPKYGVYMLDTGYGWQFYHPLAGWHAVLADWCDDMLIEL